MKKIIIFSFLCFLSLFYSIGVKADIFSDSNGDSLSFGSSGKNGTAQNGKVSSMAGVKISLYNVDANTFEYSYAIPSSNSTQARALASYAGGKLNGVPAYCQEGLGLITHDIDVFAMPSYLSGVVKWAEASGFGLNYDAKKVKGLLCGAATGSGCDATDAFYNIVNFLLASHPISGVTCSISENSNGDLYFSPSHCADVLKKYRLILEPILALTSGATYNFSTLKGIGAMGMCNGVTDQNKYGITISKDVLQVAYATRTHGNINNPQFVEVFDTESVLTRYTKLGSKTSGYGYNIFYVIPNQVDEPEPAADKLEIPSKSYPKSNTASETLQCDSERNSLYVEDTYTYTENESIQKNNPYCNVTCDTEVKVGYPNVFSVTPAGQSFELVYEPTINAKKTCHAKFNYDQWKVDYEASINYEKQALQKYNEAKAKQAQANNIVTSYKGKCNCSTDDAGVETCENSAWYINANSVQYRKIDGSNGTISAINDSYCDSNSNYIYTNYKTPANTALNKAKDQLKDRAETRLDLERYSLQCYTSLDSGNTSSVINNNDIFTEGYNTYKDTSGKPYTKDVKVSTNLQTLNSVSSGTSNEYSNYIPNAEIKLNSGIITRKTTKDFFEFEPRLSFIYNNGDEDVSETMLVEASILKDTGPYTEGRTDKIDEKNRITSSIYYDFGKNENLSFDVYKAKDIYRTVEYSYRFHEGTKYCGNLKNGDYKKCSDVVGNNDYRTLSTFTKYSNKSGNSFGYYNHNYPVKLNASKGEYNVSFELSQTGILQKVDDFTGKFACSYQVTNDLINMDDKTLDVLFRSVSTSNLDPNNRFDKNKFGENWIDEKGKTVKSLIESNAKDASNNKTKNTYNPNNLEYSFTLTPKLIKAIKEYNKDNNYSVYDLDCNDAGMECESEFLTDLSIGKVNGSMVENSYSTNINTFDISASRNKWKYYLSDSAISGCEKINLSINNMYICPKNKLSDDFIYNNYYKINGVLP